MEKLQKSWWIVTLRGVLAVIFGILAFATPELMLASLVLVFGIYAIVSGFFLLFGGFSLPDSDDKIFSIFEGLFLIFLGSLFVFLPGLSVMASILYISVYAIISGLFQFYYSIKMKDSNRNEWFGILNAVVSIIFGIALLADLIVGAEVLVMVLGMYSIFFGIMAIAISFKIKNLKN
ncbi:MAG TPA: DUF308 domain-containing protein [Ignavibacteria bacterium]|nr:DUF308 domain-containing protein [Ignavibacteria bacterium]